MSRVLTEADALADLEGRPRPSDSIEQESSNPLFKGTAPRLDPIEQEIQAKGLTAPRITPADIEANIAAEYYFTAEQAVSGFSEAMVGRFLGWKLPKDFAPDGGISFEESAWWPSGTNLLHAGQAKEMLEHVVGGAPVMPGLELLTFCVLVLHNGTKVVGINYGPVSPENFDAAMGREEARKAAIEQVWPLLGYELRSKLARTDADFRMLLKQIPVATIADFVDDNDVIKGMISSLRED